MNPINVNQTELSDMTSVNVPTTTQTAETVFTGTLPKKRKPRAQKAAEESGKRPNPGQNSSTFTAEDMDDTFIHQQDPGEFEIPTGKASPRVNYATIDGEDPDGFISLEGLQAHLKKDAAGGNTTTNPGVVRNSSISRGYQLALELQAAKKPMFATAHFIDVLDAETATLFLLPHREPEGKLIVNLFSLSEIMRTGVRRVASQVGTNLLPPIADNVTTYLNPNDACDHVVHPNERIAAIDKAGFDTFDLMWQAGKVRMLEDFHISDFVIHHFPADARTNHNGSQHGTKSTKTIHTNHTKTIIEDAKTEAQRSIPIFEDKSSPGVAYADRMLSTPASQINRSIQHERNKAEGTDKNLAEYISHTGTKTPNSYGTLGGSLNILLHLSIASHSAKQQTITQVANRIAERSICAGSPVTVIRFLKSWAANYHSLSIFGKLEWKWGKFRAILRANEYAAFTDTTEYSNQFNALLAGDGERGGDVSAHLHTIPYLKIKIENLFLLIFATVNMKYKFQIQMLQSLDKFINFLELNDMGDGNPTMFKFIEVTTTAYLNSLEKIRSKIDSSLIETDDEIMDSFAKIPDLSPDGMFQKIYDRLSIEDERGATAMVIRQANLNFTHNNANDLLFQNILFGKTHYTSADQSKDVIKPIQDDKKKKNKSEKKGTVTAWGPNKYQ